MVNPILPNGFGAKGANERQGYITEAERMRKAQQKAMNDLKSSVPAGRLKNNMPIEYDDYGIPQIDNQPQMPNIDINALNQQFEKQQQQSQPSIGNVQAAFNDTPVQKSNMDVNTFFEAPVQQPRQSQPLQPKPVAPAPIRPEPKPLNLSHHPVITKMLKNFGLKKDKRHDLDLSIDGDSEKMTYTMTEVTEELQTWALEVAKEKLLIEGNSTATVYFELLFVCCSVIAIDHQPIWEVFNITPQGNESERLLNSPFDISLRMRKISAQALCTLLWSETIPIGDKLLSFYQDVVMNKRVISSMDVENEKKIRFVCPVDDCDHYEFIIPDGKTRYCKFHGVPLVETVDLQKESDVPLA